MKRSPIGKVTHYYRRINVAVLELSVPLLKGDTIRILGHTTDLEQRIGSMEIDHKQIENAWPGDLVAIKVADRVRPGDKVFVEEKVEEEEEELAAATM